jgi:ankyrin repeat protein
MLNKVLYVFATFSLQDNYNVLHIASMYSREDVVKALLSKKGADAYSTGGVSYSSFTICLTNY